MWYNLASILPTKVESVITKVGRGDKILIPSSHKRGQLEKQDVDNGHGRGLRTWTRK